MGKKARLKKEKIVLEKKARKELLESHYYQKKPWLHFWLRTDFWIYTFCLLALVAFPFLPKFDLLNTGTTKNIAAEEIKSDATIHTSMGDIELSLYSKDAPKTVENFNKLVSQGFYNGLTWHRVIKEFVIQTGDPNGDGTGGPGYKFDDEINSHKIVKGTVAMANSGPNTNGSQFFIVTDSPQPSLDGKYTVFGEVTKGMEVVSLISQAPTDENDKPLSAITIESIEIK